MLIALDIETSVKTQEPACLTWCVAERGSDGAWRPGPENGLHARDPLAQRMLEQWLADDDVVFVGQNICFDLTTLGKWWGLLAEVRAAYEAGRVRDTMLRQHLIDIAWPARAHGVWNEEHERWFPAKFAWHAGRRRMERIDGEDDDGGGTFAKGGLDHLAWRLLAIDLSADKHGDASPRLRYHEVIDNPWDAWPENFRTYALGDPRLTLEVYFEQASIVRSRIGSSYEEGLPPLFAEGWAPQTPRPRW